MAGLFPNAPIPLEAQLACVERELGFRHGVYKRRVADGKMKQEKADQEIAAMTAVRNTLRDLIAAQPKKEEATAVPGAPPDDEDPF